MLLLSSDTAVQHPFTHPLPPLPAIESRREERGQCKAESPGPQFPSTVTACGLPSEIGDRLSGDTVRQFVEYYKILGVDR